KRVEENEPRGKGERESDGGVNPFRPGEPAHPDADDDQPEDGLCSGEDRDPAEASEKLAVPWLGEEKIEGALPDVLNQPLEIGGEDRSHDPGDGVVRADQDDHLLEGPTGDLVR